MSSAGLVVTRLIVIDNRYPIGMGNVRGCLSFGCVLVAIICGGCALDGSSSPLASDGELLTLAVGTTLEAVDLYRAHRFSGKVRITRDDEPAYTAHVSVEPEADHWRTTIETLYSSTFSQRDDGAIQTLRDEDAADSVAVDYDPPFVALPPRMIVGRPFEGFCRVRITDLDSGADRDAGTCTYRIELLGRRRVSTPAGRVDGYLVRTTRHLKLRLAEARVTTDAVYLPGRGIVREQTHQVTRVLGLFDMHNTNPTKL
jgi:hypothetical protein